MLNDDQNFLPISSLFILILDHLEETFGLSPPQEINKRNAHIKS